YCLGECVQDVLLSRGSGGNVQACLVAEVVVQRWGCGARVGQDAPSARPCVAGSAEVRRTGSQQRIPNRRRSAPRPPGATPWVGGVSGHAEVSPSAVMRPGKNSSQL